MDKPESESPQSESADQFKQQGNEHFKKKEYSKAIQAYSEAIALNDADASYYGNRAACYLSLNKYKECIRDCEAAIERDANFAKAWIRKSRSLFYSGELNQAKEAFKRAIELDPKDDSLKVEFKSIDSVGKNMKDVDEYIKQGKFTDALMDTKQTLKICPNYVPAKIAYVEVLARKMQTKEAIDRSSEFLQELASNTDFLFARGLALYYDGQPENAKKTWKEGLRLDPDNQKCRDAIKKMNRQEEAKEKGNTAFKEGNCKEAVEFYTDGIEQDPANRNLVSQLYANRAAAYMKMKNFKAASDDCDKAIEINENYAKAYLRRGDIRMELGEYEGATQDFNQAHQLDPSLGARHRIKDAEKQAKMAKRKDYYKLLEVSRDAGDDEIKKQYKKLALKWHPDKNGQTEETRIQAEAKFKEINEAYSVLSDPQKKQRYDSGADLDEMDGFGGGGGIDPNVIFQTFFGGGGGFPFGGGGGHHGGGFPGGGNFSFRFG